jgi:hypothetical protein
MEYSDSRSAHTPRLGFLQRISLNPGLIFALIIITALLAFEMFNYSTTEFALRDLLGDLRFAGLPWATILAVAFCGIDFAGIARLFTPQQGMAEPKEVWYLAGAWLLAATMNALLTWWGVAMAVVSHNVQSTAVMSSDTLVKVVPVFVALMVWVIRILIIGSLSVAGDRLIWGHTNQRSSYRPSPTTSHRPAGVPVTARTAAPAPQPVSSARMAAARPVSAARSEPVHSVSHPEPTYQSLGMAAPRPAPRPSSANRDSGSHTGQF